MCDKRRSPQELLCLRQMWPCQRTTTTKPSLPGRWDQSMIIQGDKQSPPVALLLWVNDFHNQTAFRNFHNLSVVCILSHYISKEKKSVNHTFTTSVTIFHLHFYFHLFNWLGKSKRGHHLTFECHTNPLF